MVDGGAVREAILTTLLTSGTATVLATLIGVPLGAWCSSKTAPIFDKIRVMVTALYGLPPVVVGVFVYALLSKSGVLGALDLLFTVEAMIIAQTFLIFPLIWGGSWSAFDKTGQQYRDTFDTLGATSKQRLVLEIGLARSGVYHAIVIGFGRAIAEVGAVIMVGGNIAGKTRVMTTSIVLETSKGNMDQASFLGLLLLVFSLTIVALASFVQRPSGRRSPALSGVKPPELVAYDGPSERTVSMSREGREILKPTQIPLHPGTITVVLGESGAGKTSLLRALAGLEGEDVLCGYQRCVYVPQKPLPLTHSVGSELNLASSLFEKCITASAYFSEKFSLEQEPEHSPHVLSGGELQRLILSRQLGFAPKLLLLDECTANLGSAHVKAIETELIRHRDAGVCIVLATHNVLQAKRLADAMIILHDGARIEEEGVLARSLLAGEWSG
jgi:tungstate transport system ATP-binding protein